MISPLSEAQKVAASPHVLYSQPELRRILAALVDAYRWIPVGERLPLIEEVVMVRVRGMDSTWLAYRAYSGFSNKPIMWKTQQGNMLLSDETNLTHWMPLPQPPSPPARGETEEN